MKLKSFTQKLLTVVFVATGINVAGQGIQFVKGLSWDDVIAQATKEKKYIFVNMYSTKCDECDELLKRVYVSKQVGDYFNERFISINLQVDSSKRDDADIKMWYSQAAVISKRIMTDVYPCLLFFSYDRFNVLENRVDGTVTADELIREAQNALQDGYGKKRLDKMVSEYKRGRNDLPFMRNIARSSQWFTLSDEEKVVMRKIKNEYIERLPERKIFTKGDIEFQRWATNGTSHLAFKRFFNNEAKIDRIVGKSGYAENHLVYWILEQEFSKIFAPDFVPNWDSSHQVITNKFNRQYADRAIAESKIDFYGTHGDDKRYVESTIAYMRMYGKEEMHRARPEAVDAAALYLMNNSHIKKDFLEALAWTEFTLKKIPDNAGFMNTYATLLYKLGRKHEAIAWQEKAVSQAPTSESYLSTLAAMKKGEKI